MDLSNIDTGQRPQDDFFRHVNGGWLKKTDIPSDRSNYGSFTELFDISEALQREIIESAAAKSAPAGSNADLIGNFFNAYMDEDAVNAAGAAPLQPHLQKVSAVNSPRALMTYFGEGQKYGHGSPLRFWIDQDSGDTTRYVPFITQAGISLPDRDYYLKDDEKFTSVREAYLAHIERMFGYAGVSGGAEAARDVLSLETRIAELQWERVRNRDRNATFNPVSRQELIDMLASVDMSAFLKGAGLDGQERFIVRQPSYQTTE